MRLRILSKALGLALTLAASFKGKADTSQLGTALTREGSEAVERGPYYYRLSIQGFDKVLEQVLRSAS